MAIGEAASASVHGANRLGSNALLDLVVFGRAAAEFTAQDIAPGSPHRPLPAGAGEDALDRLDGFRNAKGGTPTAALRLKMQRVDAEQLRGVPHRRCARRRVTRIAEVWAGMPDISVADRSMIWNSDLMETLELDNLCARRW